MSKPLDFRNDVSFKRMRNHEQSLILGISSNQQISDGRVTVWDGTGDVIFRTTAVEMFISSSSVGDIGQSVFVEGVDANWIPISSTATLNGQSEVSVGTYLHIQSVTVISGSVNAGDIYLAPTTARTAGVPNDLTLVLSKVILGECITHNGWSIVPASTIAGFASVRSGTDSNNKTASLSVHITPFNSPTQFVARYEVSPDFAGYDFISPIVSIRKNEPSFGEKTIIEYKSLVRANGTEIFVTSDLIFAGTKEFGTESILV